MSLIQEALAQVPIPKELETQIERVAELLDAEVPGRSAVIARYRPDGPSLAPIPLPTVDDDLTGRARAHARKIADGSDPDLWQPGDAYAFVSEVVAARHNRIALDHALRILHERRRQAIEADITSAFRFLEDELEAAVAQIRDADVELGDIESADAAISAGKVDAWTRLTAAAQRAGDVRRAQDGLYGRTVGVELRRGGWLSLKHPDRHDPRHLHRAGLVDVPREPTRDGDDRLLFHRVAPWPACDEQLGWHVPSTRPLDWWRWAAREGVALAVPTLDEARQRRDDFEERLRQVDRLRSRGLDRSAFERERRRVMRQVHGRPPETASDIIVAARTNPTANWGD